MFFQKLFETTEKEAKQRIISDMGIQLGPSGHPVCFRDRPYHVQGSANVPEWIDSPGKEKHRLVDECLKTIKLSVTSKNDKYLAEIEIDSTMAEYEKIDQSLIDNDWRRFIIRTSPRYKLTIIPATTGALRQLQKVYPPCEIINQLLTLFEILNAYTPQINGKDRIKLFKSNQDILRELINIKKTLEPYVEQETDYLSEDDRQKVREILSFDADLASTLLDELSDKKDS